MQKDFIPGKSCVTHVIETINTLETWILQSIIVNFTVIDLMLNDVFCGQAIENV